MSFQQNPALRSLLRTCLVLLLLGGSLRAYALPSYARQTGDDCATCHVGGFGPQLTPHGQRFKLTGYTDGQNRVIPLSGMVVTNFTHVAKDLDEKPADHFSTNDNFAAQEVSGFVAGRLTDHVGSFAQVTYSGVDRKWAWDNLDVRYARELSLGGKDLIAGVSLNNNPTLQDPFNSLPAWGFPYTSSDLAPSAPVGPLLAGGLEMQVLGANAYALYDKHWYVEAGGYRSLSRDMLNKFGVPKDDVVQAASLSPYARVAYTVDARKTAYSVGLVAMQSRMKADGTSDRDRYTDYGIDATYQFLGNRHNIVTFNGLLLREDQNLAASAAAGDADRASQSLNSYNFNVSYYRNQTYGASFGLFGVSTGRDATLYADSTRARASTRGEIVQLDYTPWGKEGSWLAPNLNLRLGLQYTHYDRYDGGSSNYDGSGRSASDNDTLLAFAWFAF